MEYAYKSCTCSNGAMSCGTMSCGTLSDGISSDGCTVCIYINPPVYPVTLIPATGGRSASLAVCLLAALTLTAWLRRKVKKA